MLGRLGNQAAQHGDACMILSSTILGVSLQQTKPPSKKLSVALQLALLVAPACLALANVPLNLSALAKTIRTKTSPLPNVCLATLIRHLLIFCCENRALPTTGAMIVNVLIMRRRDHEADRMLAALRPVIRIHCDLATGRWTSVFHRPSSATQPAGRLNCNRSRRVRHALVTESLSDKTSSRAVAWDR